MGKNVGDFKADLIVNQIILIELKTAETLVRAHEAEVLNYLRATSLEIGLLFNFGPRPQVRRLVHDNERKRFRTPTAGGSVTLFQITGDQFISVISGKVLSRGSRECA